jgi:hypothetical protein
MAGSLLKRQRKARVTDPVTGELIQFPRLTHPRAGLSHAEWRALSPGEKLKRLFGMSLDRMTEILSCGPVAEFDPARLNAVVTVARVVLVISARAGLVEKAEHKHNRQRVLEQLARREFGDRDRHRTGTGKTGGPEEGS